jgi:leucyl-tRNA synthetase
MHAISYQNSKFNIKEPFKGLFTQGMVCHETYKDPDNNWVSPEEIIDINGERFLKKDKTKKIKIGSSESMSKSKKNTIDPEKIIGSYGADSVRLFILSDSPPEKDVQWSDDGIMSSYKFIQKLWILNETIMSETQKKHANDYDNKITKYTNKFIKKMTDSLSSFSYNIIIASLHEMYSFFTKEIQNGYTEKTIKGNYYKILTTMLPIIPHFSSECIKKNDFKINPKWPSFDNSQLIEDKINYVIQINGKKRAIIEGNRDLAETDLIDEITKDNNINKYLKNNKFKKIIYIKNKLINIII